MATTETGAEAGGGTKDSFLNRFLGIIERAGNILPHPATLFVILAFFVLILSAITAAMGISVVHPGTKETVHAVSLLNVAGLHRILTSLVTNFTGFAPLGTVLVAMLGIAVAEGSGLISAALRAVVLSAPRRLLTMAAAFAGVSGGFCANFLLGPTDPLLAGITQEAARILDKSYGVTAAANYYFAAASA